MVYSSKPHSQTSRLTVIDNRPSTPASAIDRSDHTDPDESRRDVDGHKDCGTNARDGQQASGTSATGANAETQSGRSTTETPRFVRRRRSLHMTPPPTVPSFEDRASTLAGYTTAAPRAKECAISASIEYRLRTDEERIRTYRGMGLREDKSSASAERHRDFGGDIAVPG